MQDGVAFSEEFTREHRVLLYLISKFSRVAKTENDKEQYLRELPLRTFMYEGIVKKIFPNYDYAPISVELPGGRRYLNITQEGEDDLADLRENHLIECLKVNSSNYLPISAYRVNELGLKAIDTAVGSDIRQAVDSLVACPKCGILLEVRLQILHTGEERDIRIFVHCPKCPFEFESGITQIEDVSYEIAPYFPKIPRVRLTDRSRKKALKEGVNNE